MENKNGKEQTIVIVILVLLVLGLGGYIVYDKTMSKETGETKEPAKTEKKFEEQPKLLTNDEAVEIGKDLYIKVRDIAYNQKNEMKLDTSVCYSNENDKMVQAECGDYAFNKVSDVSFKNNFTSNGLKQYEKNATEYGGGGFIIYNGDYYIMPYKWGPFNGSWNTGATKITVKEINENSIVLEAAETIDNETINTTFTIVNENGTWKMDDYTDAGYLIWSK